MEIRFKKLSAEEHELTVVRKDGSTETRVCNSRSFLRHDLAHLAVELELPLARGFWGSVAAGSDLGGMAIRGPDIGIAETYAGSVQGLMREETEDPARFYEVLMRRRADLMTEELAARICERCRQLRGHWRATPFGETMELSWDIAEN